MSLQDLVVIWAENKGILGKNGKGTVEGQLQKLAEEFHELQDGIARDKEDEIIDAIGDMQVVLIILAKMYGLSATACLASAYSEIATRTGRMENGVFVKDGPEAEEPFYSYFEDENSDVS